MMAQARLIFLALTLLAFNSFASSSNSCPKAGTGQSIFDFCTPISGSAASRSSDREEEHFKSCFHKAYESPVCSSKTVNKKTRKCHLQRSLNVENRMDPETVKAEFLECAYNEYVIRTASLVRDIEQV